MDSTTQFKSNMTSAELDSIQLTGPQKTKGLILFLASSAIAIFVFFVSLTIGDRSQIVFGWLFNFFVDLMGDAGFWIVSAIIGGNLIMQVYSSYIDKGRNHPKLAKFYSGDNWIYTILNVIGTVYVVVYAMHITISGFVGPEFIVSGDTGGEVIPFIVLTVLWIIIVGAVFMPFLINYGLIEFIGSLLEPLMRPLFRVPGKGALDATASLLTSSSLSILITNRLYRQNTYTQKEAVTLATCFCTVSIGFSYLVIDTAGMAHFFRPIFFSSFVLAFVMAAILVRIPPISRKNNFYVDGREQSEVDIKSEVKLDARVFGRGVNRAIKRAYTSNSVPSEIKNSLLDSVKVIPKVLTMISAVGVSAMILAKYTEIFTWLGIVFQPIIQVLQIPDAARIAPSMPIGIAEMFLPVLLIAGEAAIISEQARFFVALVSILQMIFFSETASVMLATRLPVKFKEIILLFFMRTLIAMPLAAIATHIFVR